MEEDNKENLMVAVYHDKEKGVSHCVVNQVKIGSMSQTQMETLVSILTEIRGKVAHQAGVENSEQAPMTIVEVKMTPSGFVATLLPQVFEKLNAGLKKLLVHALRNVADKIDDGLGSVEVNDYPNKNIVN